MTNRLTQVAGSHSAASPGIFGGTRFLLTSLLKSNPLLIVFAAMLAVGATTSEYFLTVANLTNLMRIMAVPGLLALGVSFVLLVGRIDLTVGALMVFAPIAAVALIALVGESMGVDVMVRGNSYNASATALVAITLITGLLVGLFSGAGVVYGGITSFIMTLAMMQALHGLGYVITGGHAYYLQIPTYTWPGALEIFGIPFSFVVYVALTTLAAWVLRYTVIGRRLFAIGGDEDAAMLAGIHVKAWLLFAFAVSGVLSALAGVLFTSRLQSVDAPLGVGFELTAIAFAVVGGVSLRGGRGSPYGALQGTLVMSTLLNLFNMWGFNTWYQNIATGAIVILVVVFDRIMHRRAS